MHETGVEAASIQDVRLRVADLPRALAFYQDVLGMRPVAGEAPGALSASGRAPVLLRLEAAPDAPERPRGTAGLFHVAFLYPDRAALGAVLQRLLQLGIPLGSADHGVSEALYLSDPEGNGIELYADRPRDAWPVAGEGGVAMYTDSLAFAPLLDEGRKASADVMPPATRIGHIHLSVASLANAERFYADLLGFAVTQRSYPGALFLARGAYHHHIGTNVWRSRAPAQPGVLGLDRFTVALDEPEWKIIVQRLDVEGRIRSREGEAVLASDFDGIGVAVAPRDVR
ncbi:MAG TPA: VOC family protein [Vicinamibacterales bacterium]